MRQIIKAKKEVWANRCRCDSHLNVQLFSKQSQWGLTRVLNSQLYVTTEFYLYICMVGNQMVMFQAVLFKLCTTFEKKNMLNALLHSKLNHAFNLFDLSLLILKIVSRAKD